MSHHGQDTLMITTVDIVRLAFFRLTIDGALSQLNENFSITTHSQRTLLIDVLLNDELLFRKFYNSIVKRS